MVAWIGKWLFAVGAIHTLFGLLFMRGMLAVLWSEGLLNTVNGQPPREAVFWFLCTGLLLLIVAVMVDQAERQHLAIPRRCGLVVCCADRHRRHRHANLRHLASDPSCRRDGDSAPTADCRLPTADCRMR